MPPYVRFPGTEAISQKFWGCGAKNPTCGLISLETGAKIFAWGNMIMSAFIVVLCTLGFLNPLFSEFKADLTKTPSSKDDEEWIEAVHWKQAHGIVYAALFIVFVVYAIIWHLSWQLKDAIVDKDLPLMKKYFLLLLGVLALMTIPEFIESELVWRKSFVMTLPYYASEICGLIFTHGYIVSLISPDYSQQDDMNQFSP